MKGDIDLRDTETKTFSDDAGSWAGRIWLDGFTYNRFADCPTDWKSRLDWLNRQPEDHLGKDFRPQPWAQLIKALRQMGHDEDARMIAIERARAIERKETRRPVKLWYRFLGATVGYGYRPWRPLIWSAGFLLVGWLVFWTAADMGYMAPRDGTVITYLTEHPDAEVPVFYPEYSAFMYALDAYLPVIEFGQISAWEPTANKSRPVATHDPGLDWMTALHTVPVLPESFFRFGGHRIVFWLENFFGWLFVSLFIAGMSGIMKQE
jgi:hypothetical protein